MAIVCRIIGVTLLLIILADSLCSSTVLSSGKRKCPFLFVPINDTEKNDQTNRLSSEPTQHTSRANGPVPKRDILSCRCTRIAKGRLKCPPALLPTNHRERQHLNDCLCRKAREQNRPQLQVYCGFNPATML